MVRVKLEEEIEAEAEAMRFKPFDKIRPRAIEWLWKNRIPAGKLTMLVGEPGVGKSMITCYIAAVLSCAGTKNARPWPDGSKPPKKGRVLFIACEDNPEDTIWARLKAAGADMERVEVLIATEMSGKDGEWTLDKVGPLQRYLEDADKDGRGYSAVIIDPISAYLPGGMEGNNDAEVRGLLRPLVELGDRWGLTIISVKHKPKNATKAINSASGSIAWTAAARVAYSVSKDPNDAEQCLFLEIKNNVGPKQKGLAYKLVATEVSSGTDAGLIETARVDWLDREVTMTADEALNATASSRAGKEQDAVKFVKEELSHGPQPAVYMERRAEELGIAPRTLNRAKRALDVKSYRKPGYPNSPWMWSLPDE